MDWQRAYQAIERWHEWEEHRGLLLDCDALQCAETRARCLSAHAGSEPVGPRERLQDGDDGRGGAAAQDGRTPEQIPLEVALLVQHTNSPPE